MKGMDGAKPARRREGGRRRAAAVGFRVGLAALAGWAGELGAHRDPNAGVPAVGALFITEEVAVDGRLDEGFWAAVPATTGLIDKRTQGPAPHQTILRIAYDTEKIYVGLELLEPEPGAIAASEQREDRAFTGDDFLQMHFDPLHNHRSKYAFFSNALGTKADANEGPSGVFNYGWSALAQWDCATSVQGDRWVIEMALPLAMMNYELRDNQTWGLNVTRARRASDELSFWSFSPTDTYKPRYFGHLTGLDLAGTRFDRNYELTPYVSGLADLETGDGNEYTFEAGADLGFRLTPASTVALTFNPDFGQVEADAATIDLLDTERFLPEKRPFFREGEELMRMPNQLYYSRRFTDITGGGKVTGVTHGHNFFLQNLYGEVTHRNESDKGNHLVFRMQHNVGERSSVMGYVADSEMKRGHSRVVGADTTWFLNRDWFILAQGAVANDRREAEDGTVQREGTDYLADAALVYSHYPWRVEAGYVAISEDFDPILSFIPRRNIFGPGLAVDYNQDGSGQWYKNVTAFYDFDYFEDAEGATTLRDHLVGGRLLFPNDVAVRANVAHDFHAPYTNTRAVGGVALWASNQWKSIDLAAAVGEFEETPYRELIFSKPIKPLERLPIYYDLRVRFEDDAGGEEETIWLNQIVFDFFIREGMWVKSSLQHQNDDVHNISVIYGWEFVRDAHFYLAYNDIEEKAGLSRSLFSKVTYTFLRP